MSHVCKCQECAAELFKVPEERQGEAHFAVRFGDVAHRFRVFIGDRDISVECFEAMGGKWAMFYSKPEGATHVCETCRSSGHPGACAERYDGDDVRIEAVL